MHKSFVCAVWIIEFCRQSAKRNYTNSHVYKYRCKTNIQTIESAMMVKMRVSVWLSFFFKCRLWLQSNMKFVKIQKNNSKTINKQKIIYKTKKMRCEQFFSAPEIRENCILSLKGKKKLKSTANDVAVMILFVFVCSFFSTESAKKKKRIHTT